MNKKIVEDEQLWEIFTKGIKKINHSKVPNLAVKQKQIKIRFANEINILPDVSRETLKLGNLKNLDTATGTKFSKGKMKIDGKLDLHGLTAKQAFISLKEFLNKHYSRASRCLIVITGKGGLQVEENGEIKKTGIRTRLLPVWLNDKELKPMILSFTIAKDKDGGNGAFYILLKRQRKK